MKALIISDVHDQIANLETALEIAKTSSCDSVICCGDLCSPFIIDIIDRNCSLPVHITFGNNDGDKYTMVSKVNAANKNRNANSHIILHGEFLIAEKNHDLIGIPSNISLVVYHYPPLAKAVAKSSAFDFIFYGHTHISSLEVNDKCIIANPGSIMGYTPSMPDEKVKPSCLIVNWHSKEIELIEF